MKRRAWASLMTIISSFACWLCTMPVSRHSCEDPIEVGQVEEHDAVRGLEQVVSSLAEVLLYLCLFLQEPVRHAVHLHERITRYFEDYLK